MENTHGGLNLSSTDYFYPYNCTLMGKTGSKNRKSRKLKLPVSLSARNFFFSLSLEMKSERQNAGKCATQMKEKRKKITKNCI